MRVKEKNWKFAWQVNGKIFARKEEKTRAVPITLTYP